MGVTRKTQGKREDRGATIGVALIYLMAVTVNELLATLYAPRWGLALHGSLLLIMLLHTAMIWEQPLRDLLLTLAFAPLIRMVSLTLPLIHFPLVYWYLLTSIPLFAAVYIAMRTLRYDGADVGMTVRRWWLQLPLALIGLGFGLTEYGILKPQPLAATFTLRDIWLPALILLVSTGFAEEIIFRGLMQRAARDVLGEFSVTYVSLLFAVLHVGYKSVTDVIFVFGVAIVFGYITERTRSIFGVSLAHGLTNIVLFLVGPFVL